MDVLALDQIRLTEESKLVGELLILFKTQSELMKAKIDDLRLQIQNSTGSKPVLREFEERVRDLILEHRELKEIIQRYVEEPEFTDELAIQEFQNKNEELKLKIQELEERKRESKLKLDVKKQQEDEYNKLEVDFQSLFDEYDSLVKILNQYDNKDEEQKNAIERRIMNLFSNFIALYDSSVKKFFPIEQYQNILNTIESEFEQKRKESVEQQEQYDKLVQQEQSVQNQLEKVKQEQQEKGMKLKELLDKVKELESENEEIEQDKMKMEREIQQLENRIENLGQNEKTNKLQERKQLLEKQISDMEKEQLDIQNEIDSLEAKIESEKVKFDQLKNQRQDLKSVLNSISEELNQVEKEIESLENQNQELKRKLEEGKLKLQQLENENIQLKSESDEVLQKLEELKQNVFSASQVLPSEQQEIIKNLFKTLLSQGAEGTILQMFQNQIEELNKRLQQQTQLIDDLQNERQQLLKDKSDLLSQLEEFREQGRLYEKNNEELEKLRLELVEKNKQIQEVKREEEVVKSEQPIVEEAVETVKKAKEELSAKLQQKIEECISDLLNLYYFFDDNTKLHDDILYNILLMDTNLLNDLDSIKYTKASYEKHKGTCTKAKNTWNKYNLGNKVNSNYLRLFNQQLKQFKLDNNLKNINWQKSDVRKLLKKTNLFK